jgi:hypothetical protein
LIFLTVSDDDDRDIDRRGHSYVTRRDLLLFLSIGVVVIGLAYIFWFRPWKANRDYVVSQSNLQEIARAIGLYAEANNDGLPPVLQPSVQDSKGRSITWANQVFEYISRPEVFNNAANPEEGNTPATKVTTTGEQIDVSLSYGMLSSADTARRYEIRDETILIAETIGSGVSGSYNPTPLGGADGFLIGYDNSNGMPDPNSKFVTRLAFVAPGVSPLGLTPIHPKGALGIRADGGIAIFESASEAFKVSRVGKNPSGHWVPY